MSARHQRSSRELRRNVRRQPGGCFVIEAIVPPWQRFAPGETVIPFDVSPAHLGFDEIDVATLVDPAPRHVEQATRRAGSGRTPAFEACLGTAGDLPADDASVNLGDVTGRLGTPQLWPPHDIARR